MVKIKVTFFKETGKYYTEEYTEIEKDTPIFELVGILEERFSGQYKGMHMVAMLDEMEHGFPVMIPGDRR